jgi:curved DNA-binding protein CbpA
MHPSLFPYHPERDVYRLLQVDSTADNREITAACRRLARTFHPDRNQSVRAEEEMRVVNAVREMLTDPRERAAYDRARERYLTGWTPGATVAADRVAAPAVLAGPGWLARSRLPEVVERTLRALVAAFRAALGDLWVTRCPACGEVVEPEFLFCASCGTRVRRARRLMPPRE